MELDLASPSSFLSHTLETHKMIRWTNVRLMFVFLFLRITVLSCLMSSSWKPLFYICIYIIFFFNGASLMTQMVKNVPGIQETQVWSPGWEDPLQKGMPTHSSILNPMDSGAQWVTIHEVARIGYDLVTTPPPTVYTLIFILILAALGPQSWVQAFSSCGKQGLLFTRGGQVSHWSGFSCCGA